MCDHELCGCSLCAEATFDYPLISRRCVCSDALWVDVGRSSSLWFHLQPEKEEKDDAISFQSLVSELFTGALLQDLTAIWRINSSSCCDAAASAPVSLVIDAVKSFLIQTLSLTRLIFRGTSEKRTVVGPHTVNHQHSNCNITVIWLFTKRPNLSENIPKVLCEVLQQPFNLFLQRPVPGSGVTCTCTYPGHCQEEVSGGLGPLSRRAVGLHFGRQNHLKYLQSKLFTTLISKINALIWHRRHPSVSNDFNH